MHGCAHLCFRTAKSRAAASQRAALCLGFPSDLTVLGPRRVALKVWDLDAAKEIDCPSLCLCPSEGTQLRLPWGVVGLHKSARLDHYVRQAEEDPGRQALQLLS